MAVNTYGQKSSPTPLRPMERHDNIRRKPMGREDLYERFIALYANRREDDLGNLAIGTETLGEEIVFAMTYYATPILLMSGGGLKAWMPNVTYSISTSQIMSSIHWMLRKGGFEETDRAIWEPDKATYFYKHAGNIYGNIEYTEYKRTAAARTKCREDYLLAYEERREAINHFERARKQRNDDLGGMRVVEASEAQ